LKVRNVDRKAWIKQRHEGWGAGHGIARPRLRRGAGELPAPPAPSQALRRGHPAAGEGSQLGEERTAPKTGKEPNQNRKGRQREQNQGQSLLTLSYRGLNPLLAPNTSFSPETSSSPCRGRLARRPAAGQLAGRPARQPREPDPPGQGEGESPRAPGAWKTPRRLWARTLRSLIASESDSAALCISLTQKKIPFAGAIKLFKALSPRERRRSVPGRAPVTGDLPHPSPLSANLRTPLHLPQHRTGPACQRPRRCGP